ncbi:DNA-binding protein [Elizabethkingia anophelis]|uniref:DNA-binding protein n=1 Tax=Elizabethkingia anophelis TaxID=1117645 RepID=UPI0021A319BD|nr:DNA-binding protein [Elizabethkingia anophelis]MCT3633693.1 DNA-binding protein [Elizabethkingia anophelis]MCT3830374.1 DNA-binding protein [Elizabethkingia anophelis]MCT3883897.1 DNA-binding protein [Elizabethkingia anophelis]MCT3894665.1 DNA-binding protein [Elizabethkingia anophelis]
MEKDLTNSIIERKNILNNNTAIKAIYDNIGFQGILFEGKYRFTKSQVANFYEVDSRTIDRLLENNNKELQYNGYEVFTGVRLRLYKETIHKFINDGEYGNDINVATMHQLTENEVDSLNKTSILATFTFKTFLNIGMLLTGSEKAQKLRSIVLDIVIDVLNKKLGGSTKFINQREQHYLDSAMREFEYRREFTNAIDEYISKNNFKYAQLTDKVYKSIFKENAKEYKQILKLGSNDNMRNTMYSEILDLISSYENGFANYLKEAYSAKKRKLSLSEANDLFHEFEDKMNYFVEPLREKARTLMASRDLVFREVLHDKLENYIKEVSAEDFDKFLGEQSMSLEQRLEENKDVFKRLKNR